MEYSGRVRNGVIVLEGDVRLPEGTEVRVDVVSNGEKSADGRGETLYDALKPLIGSLTDAPPDLARNHDHYLYGISKQP